MIAQVADCDAEDIDDAVAAALRLFEDGRWRMLTLHGRKQILRKQAELMVAERRELAVLESIDMGKPERLRPGGADRRQVAAYLASATRGLNLKG